MKEVLVVLGSPNSAEGELYQIAKDRLDYCYKIFDKAKHLILCTGGFGAHFNITEVPHAQYAKNYLMKKGIVEPYFLELALSGNTVEDAVKGKAILSDCDFPSKIITSEYHLPRVKIIFDIIWQDRDKVYVGVEHDFVPPELIVHEQKAVEGLLTNGLYY